MTDLLRNEERYTVFDFADTAQAERFRAIDDRVMGGVSSSALMSNESGRATFAGIVSFENGGGFASIRASELALDARGFEGVVVKAVGDGKRYKLRLMDSELGDPPVYQAAFDTAPGELREHYLPFSAFTASRRGRELPGAPPLDTSHIVALGFLISDRQSGPFRLELDQITLYRS